MMQFNEWVQTLTPAQKDAWDLDEATVQMIEDRFYYREICDDEKMVRFFQRTLDTVRDRYRDILRIETIKFDPLVSRYFEGEFTTDGSETMNKTGNSSGGGSKTTINANDETHFEHTDNDLRVVQDYEKDWGYFQDDADFDNTGHDGREGNNTTNGTVRSQHDTNTTSHTVDHTETESQTDGTSAQIDRHAGKQAPMNASGVTLNHEEVGQTTGMLDNLDFDYSTMYSQDDRSNKNHSETHDKTDSTSDTSGTDSGTSMDITSNTHTIHEGVDRHDEGENHLHRDYQDEHDKRYNDQRDIDVDGTKHNEGSSTTTDSRTGTSNEMSDATKYQVRHDRYTGRDNVLPQDALKAAMNYLQNYSTAFEWLCNKLEINFIGVYDI